MRSYLRHPLTYSVLSGCLLSFATVAHAATYYTQQGVNQKTSKWGVCVYQQGGGGQIAGVQMNLSWDPSCMKASSKCTSNPQTTKTVHSTTKGDSMLKAIYLSFSDTDPIPDGLLFCCDFDLSGSASGNGCPVTISELIGSSGAGQRMPVQAGAPGGGAASGGLTGGSAPAPAAQAPANLDSGDMGGGTGAGTGGGATGSGSTGTTTGSAAGAGNTGSAAGAGSSGGATGNAGGLGANAGGGTGIAGGGTGSAGGVNAGAGTGSATGGEAAAPEVDEADEGNGAGAANAGTTPTVVAATSTPKPAASATPRPVASPTKTLAPVPTETPKSGLGGCQLMPR